MLTVAANLPRTQEKTLQHTNNTTVKHDAGSEDDELLLQLLVGCEPRVGCAVQQQQKLQSIRSTYEFPESVLARSAAIKHDE